MHPGAVCLATIPPVQNPSPRQRCKHPFACLLPQKPFDREFSPPRRAQLFPMIPPLPPKLSRTLPYPPPFPPLSSGRFLTTLPIPPVRQMPLAYSPASAGRSPTPLFSPSTLHTLVIRQTLYRAPGIFPYTLSHCLPDLLVFIHPTHYYDFLAYNRPPTTRPLHYWYHNLVSSELLISIIYFAFICIHDYRLLIKWFPLSSRSGGFFGVSWGVRRFSRQRHTCINYSPPLVCDTAS